MCNIVVLNDALWLTDLFESRETTGSDSYRDPGEAWLGEYLEVPGGAWLGCLCYNPGEARLGCLCLKSERSPAREFM